MKLEERIKEIEKAVQDMERLAKAKSSDEASTDVVKGLAARNAIENAVKRLSVIMRNERMGTIPLSAKSLFNAATFRHSTIGTARAVSSGFSYYQQALSDIRGGQRFMDRFSKRFVGVNETFRMIYPTPFGAADDVAEGDVKPQRQYAFNAQDYPFAKLAVTDTITQELILADTGEQAANYIIDALVEHVKDVLNQRLITFLASNATVFDPASYAGILNIQSGTARWHDLIAAMQIEFERNFADHFIEMKYGDVLITSPFYYYGILQDRKAAGLELYYEPNLLGNLSLSSIWKDSSFSRMLLTHTDALTIELIDDVQIYYNRVADRADERNLSRITVEVFYRFVPKKLPLPAVLSRDPINDLQAL